MQNFQIKDYRIIPDSNITLPTSRHKSIKFFSLWIIVLVSNIVLGDFDEDFLKEGFISNCLTELNISRIAGR